MYDAKGSDSGREWVEVFNDETTAIDISKYTLSEGGTNHKLKVSQGTAVLVPESVMVIADNPSKFLADYPNYTGPLIDSTFGLSNDGEHLSIKDKEGKEIAYTTYSAKEDANGTGLSLARGLRGSFVASNATPGVFVASPAKVTVLREKKTETKQKSGPLQRGASGEDKNAFTASAHAAVNNLPQTPLSVLDAPTESKTLIYLLGVAGLILLGGGYVVAVQYARAHPSQKEDREFQKLVDSFEIIE